MSINKLTKKQKKALAVIQEYFSKNGYPPTLEEIGKKMDIDSISAVHKHVKALKEKGYLKGEMVYQKYKQRGFSTPTKKVELYSTILEKWGYDPLPKYVEVPESPISKPDVAERYPYILDAGLRTPTYFHTANRAQSWLREIREYPIVEIHPETANKHAIKEGQWVYIESPRGKIKQRAKLNDGIDPRVIVAEHGWWYPEMKEEGHGWDVSNINMLTDNAFDTLDPAMGSTNLRVCLCNVSPCNDA